MPSMKGPEMDFADKPQERKVKDVAPGIEIEGEAHWMDVLRNEPKVAIKIHNQEGFEGKDPVVIGINGFVLRIMRNKVVKVPQSFVANLETCQYDIISKDDEGNDVISSVPRFSWSLA